MAAYIDVAPRIDISAVIKKASDKVADMKNFPDESRAIAMKFGQELGRTEFYTLRLNQRIGEHSGAMVDSIGSIQRSMLDVAKEQVQKAWDDFVILVEEPYGLQQAATWPKKSVYEEGKLTKSSSSMGSFQWAIDGKARAGRLLSRIQELNNYLQTSVQEMHQYFTRDNPSVIPSLMEALATSEKPRDSLSVHLKRLTIQRKDGPSSSTLLRTRHYLTEVEDIYFGPTSTLKSGIAHGGTPVLIESIRSADFTSETVKTALKVAMMLNQPSVNGFGVLRCDGIVQDDAKGEFQFIFDMTEPRKDVEEGRRTLLRDEAVQALRSVYAELSEPIEQKKSNKIIESDKDKDGQAGEQHQKDHNKEGTVNGEMAVSVSSAKEKAEGKKDRLDAGQFKALRYSRFPEQRFKPLSVNQRLKIAISLAETVKQLHQAEWVHGNITSKNVYYFQQEVGHIEEDNAPKQITLKNVYLFGFQFMRKTEAYSDQRAREGYPIPDNFYRHPERRIIQGELLPTKPHREVHDIYSLGVVFLEVGLGRTALELARSMRQMRGNYANQDKDIKVALSLAQDFFCHLAETYLPEKMGSLYASIVYMCLAGTIAGYSDEEGSGEQLSVPLAMSLRVIDPLKRLLDAME